MAIIHQATLSPSKLELLGKHLASLPPLAIHTEGMSQIGAYRFDDPAGHVGIETHVLKGANNVVLQVPLTYRNEKLDGADQWFVGSMEHSVLGTRWVYNGCGDHIYINQLLQTIVGAGTEVSEIVETPQGPVPRDATVNVRGSGAVIDVSGAFTSSAIQHENQTEITVAYVDGREHTVAVRHVLAPPGSESDTPHLSGIWDRDLAPTVLATIR